VVVLGCKEHQIQTVSPKLENNQKKTKINKRDKELPFSGAGGSGSTWQKHLRYQKI
jgi:hypothetical protein